MKLVPDTISQDTAEALAELLKQAKDGDLHGFAFVAMYKRSKFIVNAAGDLQKNRTLARGMVTYLDDFLAKSPREDDPSR